MEAGLPQNTDNLTVEQLMALISRIDSAMQDAAEEPLQSSEADLLAQCSALEQRLDEEQTKRRQLEFAYNSIISSTYELRKDLISKSDQAEVHTWKERWNQSEQDKSLLASELDKVKEQCRRALQDSAKARIALAVLEGDKETFKRMTSHQLIEEERRLLKALSVLHEAKAELQASEQSLCLICEERKLAVLFRPCNHVCVCEVCARAVDACPICRGRIAAREKVFIQ
jgi:hypothetical protein